MEVDEDGSEVLRDSDGELRRREASGLPWKKGFRRFKATQRFQRKWTKQFPVLVLNFSYK